MKAELAIQSETAECGLVCLAAASDRLGASMTMQEVRQRYPISVRGTSLKQLIGIAADMRMQARPIRCELEDLPKLAEPTILHWQGNHFVLLTGIHRGKYKIFDPNVGERLLTASECSKRFTGAALELRADAGFERRRAPSQLSIFSFIQLTRELKGALGYALFFSALLQLLAILSPMFLQISVDTAIGNAENDFYLTIAIGFASLCVLSTILEALRSFLVARISLNLSWSMTRRLFRQMIRLPLPWFQRRRLADAMSRFDSISQIRQLISSGLVTSALDTLLIAFLLLAISFYSGKLALVIFGSTMLIVFIRLGTIATTMRYGAEQLQSDIAERGFRIETIRTIQSIKASGSELQRENAWANKFGRSITQLNRQETFRVSTGALVGLIEGLSAIVVTYIGVMEAKSGALTIGAMYAVLAYRQQFSNRIAGILAYAISWRQADIHSHRVADIVLTPGENDSHQGAGNLEGYKGSITIQNLSFRYSSADPPILSNINFHVKAGSFVVITGASGAGKSTLLKILASLYATTSGDILMDGDSTSTIKLSEIRRHIGTVLQEDELIAGTIAENIALHTDDYEVERVWESLKLAQMERDVRALPMQISTDVGDMGSTFSAGQRQRLILARALYRRPKVLLLDEATAHLDPANESRIHEVLSALKITRIAVAHRAEMVAIADKVYTLIAGRLMVADRNISAERQEAPLDGRVQANA